MKCNKCNYIKINICVCYKFDSILSIHRITYHYLLIMSLQTESVSDSVSTSELSLLQQKKELLQEIVKYENDLLVLKKKKHDLELAIWDDCEHEWQRDVTAAFDDICKYRCYKCNLYKNRNLYIY